MLHSLCPLRLSGWPGHPHPLQGPSTCPTVKGVGPSAGRASHPHPHPGSPCWPPADLSLQLFQKTAVGRLPWGRWEGCLGAQSGLPAWMVNSSLNFISAHPCPCPTEESTKYLHHQQYPQTVPGQGAKLHDPRVGGNSHQFGLAARWGSSVLLRPPPPPQHHVLSR